MPYTVSLVSAHPGGMKPRIYYLQLTWTDSTDPNAVSNNIYRGTVSGGPYTKIANVANGIQVYNDFQVTPEIPYFYVMTEVDNTNTESPNSVEISATPGWIY